MSHTLSHRIALYATAVSVLFLMLCVPFHAAQSQRQRAPSPNTKLTPVGAAPSLVVHPATWDEQNVRMGWAVPASPTAIVISRSVAGAPWQDIATVTKGQEYTDVGGAKLVTCGGLIEYRVTAHYGAPSAPGWSPPRVPGSPTPAPGVSAPVTWQREMPNAVANLSANSPGANMVNLQWTNATPVHVFRHGPHDWTRITSKPVHGNSVGEQNVPRRPAGQQNMHSYIVAPACDVTGQDGGIAPSVVTKHKHINVVIQ